MLKITPKREFLLILTVISVFTALYTFIGINKHYHFQTFAWDTSVFVQELYLVSNLKPPLSSLHHQMNGLADHFQVTFLLIGGLFYKLWSHPNVIFFIQALAGCLSAWPLFLLSKLILASTKISKTGITILSLGIVMMYLGSVSFQAMMADEFHNEPLAALSLLWMIYCYWKKINWGYWVSLFFLLLTKEIFSLLVVGIGLYIGLTSRQRRKALLTITVGLLSFYLLVFNIMPYLSGTTKYYHFTYGNNPDYVLAKFINSPDLLITQFFDHPQKRKTLAVSFLSYGLLPVLSPSQLLLPAVSLAIRFYDDTTPRLYEFNNHYAVPLMSLMAVTAIFGLARLLKFCQNLPKKTLTSVWLAITGLMILTTLVLDIVLHGPVNSIFKTSFYQSQEWENDARELIARVPEEVIVASQNSLLPHLSDRDRFYLLPEVGNAEYIAVDLADGPNKFSPLDQSQMAELITGLIKDQKYMIVWQKNQAILLRRTKMAQFAHNLRINLI